MPNFNRKDGIVLTDVDLAEIYARFPQKYLWFAQHGYKPHYWQTLFHGATNPETERLCRFRHLVAGRRGGKTLSAAWDMLFYLIHPRAYFQDFHGVDMERPLVAWVVTKDYPTGLWSLLAVREVLKQANLTHGVEYKENRGNRWFEFANGSFLLFKTAEDPESLRGAGLDWMWYDESAIIPDERAWQVSSPALAEKEGAFVSTTTPDGKNWHYNTFWSPESMHKPDTARIEYYSIDNPYFPTREWERIRKEYHPLMFKREFMASFDAMAGKELSGDWLHFYELSDIEYLRRHDGTYDLDVFVAVDPAISLADTADRFAISAIGVTKNRTQAYLLDQWAGRIPFPEQVDKINQWFHRYHPHTIAIEKTAYQAALAQQVSRLEGFPPVAAIWTKGKKFERILAMAPLFRIGRVLVRKDQIDFINEWVDYDSEKKNPADDCLDSVEMALRAAGILLPGSSEQPWIPDLSQAATTASMWNELANKARVPVKEPLDDIFGDEW